MATETGRPAFTSFLPRDGLRQRIGALNRAPEPRCVAALLDAATLAPEQAAQAAATARALVLGLRAKPGRGLVSDLVQEYALSSQEGVALMCLAEALLRIPDSATRDALIRDKLAGGDWLAHVGHGRSIFVNAATWGLVVTGQLSATARESTLGAALRGALRRGGAPLIRRGVDLAMRMMGEQFVTGQTIAEALSNSRPMVAKGFRYSYDMLGEAAATAADAARYLAAYTEAIHAIGTEAAGRGFLDGPGISIKLSALHPRYARAKIERVMAELLPRVAGLARLARQYDIGLNIDAEEADRLELSLDLIAALCADPALAGWNGLGFVVQAYQKRCPAVIDFLADLARRSGRRLMVRLVKGAYWDSEIKRAQVDGMADFPVFTRKVHTDVSYLACARRLLAARDAVFPQFATHNAQSVAAILAMAGPGFRAGDYEFQCLHGMGEPLYEEVVAPLGRPCRIYAPVGTHETLLAYLVRRLLENGANTSFVNRIADPAVAVDDLIADPAATVRAMTELGAPHPRIAAPAALYGTRRNSAGLDLADEAVLAGLASAGWERSDWRGGGPGPAMAVRNPADRRDVVGWVREAGTDDVAVAVGRAATWPGAAAGERARWLERAAAALEGAMGDLVPLIVREAGRTAANAVGEVREAVDFLRFYVGEAGRVAGPGSVPLGVVACISPWNFPLAIFTGQVAAALAAGNAVLAKPAGETPLIAAAAVALLHGAGVPPAALHLLPGPGSVGAALAADPRVQGVLFTGSTAVARSLQRTLAGRLRPDGRPEPLIAETGGINAMIVDSTALAEQVVADAVTSAFDSAGQRCSALRILCLQEDVAGRMLAMLRGALHELETGDPRRLACDLGPVISERARQNILGHIEAMRARGCTVMSGTLAADSAHGTFVAPTIIEIGRVAEVEREVFGPVLHVLRYRREDLDQLVGDINASGYGLTFGIHSRIEETIEHLAGAVHAGNIYVNRNMIGAVVGVQPFGGGRLSGTGPKAGGRRYVGRLLAAGPLEPVTAGRAELAGPVGERNLYWTVPRGRFVALGAGVAALRTHLAAIAASGNRAAVTPAGAALLGDGGAEVVADWTAEDDLAGVLHEGGGLPGILAALAARPGAILPVVTPDPDGRYDPAWLVEERSMAVNTAAAGGNASLMTIG